MLSAILSKNDCAQCKFCCSFRRKSLWETPVFTKNEVEKLLELYPDVKFRAVGVSSFTFDISANYKTDDSEEEAACPFLDTKKGCILPPELKPFDCKIWPLRAVRMNGEEKKARGDGRDLGLRCDSAGQDFGGNSDLVVALTPTCPAINKLPLEKVRELVKSGLGEKILAAARQNPDMVKENSDFFTLLD